MGLDFFQWTTGVNADEYFFVVCQFLDVQFGVLWHSAQFFGEWGQGSIEVQQKDNLVFIGLDESVGDLFTKIRNLIILFQKTTNSPIQSLDDFLFFPQNWCFFLFLSHVY